MNNAERTPQINTPSHSTIDTQHAAGATAQSRQHTTGSNTQSGQQGAIEATHIVKISNLYR